MSSGLSESPKKRRGGGGGGLSKASTVVRRAGLSLEISRGRGGTRMDVAFTETIVL